MTSEKDKHRSDPIFHHYFYLREVQESTRCCTKRQLFRKTEDFATLLPQKSKKHKKKTFVSFLVAEVRDCFKEFVRVFGSGRPNPRPYDTESMKILKCKTMTETESET